MIDRRTPVYIRTYVGGNPTAPLHPPKTPPSTHPTPENTAADGPRGGLHGGEGPLHALGLRQAEPAPQQRLGRPLLRCVRARGFIYHTYRPPTTRQTPRPPPPPFHPNQPTPPRLPPPPHPQTRPRDVRAGDVRGAQGRVLPVLRLLAHRLAGRRQCGARHGVQAGGQVPPLRRPGAFRSGLFLGRGFWWWWVGFGAGLVVGGPSSARRHRGR